MSRYLGKGTMYLCSAIDLFGNVDTRSTNPLSGTAETCTVRGWRTAKVTRLYNSMGSWACLLWVWINISVQQLKFKCRLPALTAVHPLLLLICFLFCFWFEGRRVVLDSTFWKVKGLCGSFGKRDVLREEQEWWKEWQGKRMKDERRMGTMKGQGPGKQKGIKSLTCNREWKQGKKRKGRQKLGDVQWCIR